MTPPSPLSPLPTEWCIGSHPGASDVLPKVVVANGNVSRVGIVSGRLQLDGRSTNITIGDYARSSFHPAPPPDPASGQDDDPGALFRMEPGRCLSQQLFGVSRSHRERALDLMPVCFMRESILMKTEPCAESVMKAEPGFLWVGWGGNRALPLPESQSVRRLQVPPGAGRGPHARLLHA